MMAIVGLIVMVMVTVVMVLKMVTVVMIVLENGEIEIKTTLRFFSYTS